MAIKDLAKERSQFAYGCVEKAIQQFPKQNGEKESKKQKEYKAYIKKIPMMILTNGLGATFAFVYSKKKNGNAYELIYNQTKEWFEVPQNVELVKWIIDQESPEYRAVTNEVLALFNWLKRFADGMIEGDGDGNE